MIKKKEQNGLLALHVWDAKSSPAESTDWLGPLLIFLRTSVHTGIKPKPLVFMMMKDFPIFLLNLYLTLSNTS